MSMGFTDLMNGGSQVWLSLIASNAILSALSYAPAETYAAKHFSQAAELFKKADQLKSQGFLEKAEEQIKLAQKTNKKAGRVLDIWLFRKKTR